MSRSVSIYVCQSCGAQTRQFFGRCNNCGEWNSIIEEKINQNNQLLKEKLVLNIQQDPDTTYNKLLSGLYIIEKQYKKAFIQEKAILSREEGTYYQLIELARLTEKSGDFNLASSIYNFIIERCPSIDMQLLANQKYSLNSIIIYNNIYFKQAVNNKIVQIV